MSTLKNIKGKTEGIFKDRGSKFLAYLFPIKSEEDVDSLMAILKKDHSKARHHCYAYRLGEDAELIRSSDDGEPSGSAGLPILNQLRSFEVTNVFVVVVRYFGGTKLGMSGLIRAYKESAKDALSKAILFKVEKKWEFGLQFNYPELNAVMSMIHRFDLEMTNEQYGTPCIIQIITSLDQKNELTSYITALNGVDLISM